ELVRQIEDREQQPNLVAVDRRLGGMQTNHAALPLTCTLGSGRNVRQSRLRPRRTVTRLLMYENSSRSASLSQCVYSADKRQRRARSRVAPNVSSRKRSS